MDFFQFDQNGKIYEHWDAIQQIPINLPIQIRCIGLANYDFQTSNNFINNGAGILLDMNGNRQLRRQEVPKAKVETIGKPLAVKKINATFV